MCHCHNRQREEQYHGTVRRRHSPAPSTPSRTQRENPPRLSQTPTQPMEWTPTSTKDHGITSKTPPRHSQENTMPAPPQLAELHTQYRVRLSQEAIQHLATNTIEPAPTTATLPLAQYQHTGKDQTTHITDAAQLLTHRRRVDDLREILHAGCLPKQKKYDRLNPRCPAPR